MAGSFDQSLGSISVSISKGSVYESGELSMYDAALEDALGREGKSISNESIQKGDTLLETYTVEANAISGGMGSVWRVHHQSWNTDLAMKRPQPRFFAEGSKRRKENFIKECEAWINLGLHPNIVSCYYVREIGGVPTIFSEWIDNGSLKDRIKDGSLYEGTQAEQTERLMDLAIQFARGLRYSHENGLIHRDVKPDNLMLTKDWDAKVADFGLAKARDKAISEEGAEHKGGYTPEYCSSEQAAGLIADALTDIYSWALSVLEMYTKGRVWESGPAVSENREQYINAIKLPLPEGLRRLLYGCLEADADKRPGDFVEIEATMHEIYKAETGSEYPRPAPKAAVDTADTLNNRALSMIDLGKPEEAEKLWMRALGMEPDNLDCVFNQSLYLWRRNRISGEKANLLCESAAATQPFRQLAATWRGRLQRESGMRGDSSGVRLTCDTEELKGPISLSWDGSLLLVGRVLLKLVDIRNDSVIQHYKTVGESFSFVKLLSDGLRFLTVGEKTVRLWSIRSGKSRVLCLPKSSHYLSADETCLYLYDQTSATLYCWNIDTGECELTIGLSGTGLDFEQNCYCVSPDRSTLYQVGKRMLSVINLASGSIARTYQLKDGEYYIYITYDGARLYLHSFSDHIEVRDTANMTLIQQIEVQSSMIDSLHWSQDNRVIALADLWKTIHVWQDSHAGCLASLKAQDGLVGFTLSGDGNVIVSHEARDREYYFRVWRTAHIQPTAFEVSRAIGVTERAKNVLIFEEACSLAQIYLQQENIVDALMQIHRASSIYGAVSNEHIRELRACAGKYCIRNGILGSYVHRSQSGTEYSAEAICLSADGQSYFTANNKDQSFLQWDFRSGSLICTFGKYEHGYKTVYMAADDRYLYTRDSSGAFSVWDILRGELISKRMPLDGNCELCFTRDRHRVLFTNGEKMVLEKSLDGTVVQEFKEHEHIYFDCIRSVSFSPDEKFVMVDDMRHNTVVWDVQKGDLCYQKCVPYQVYTEFSLDGKILAMKTDDDRSGVLFDTNTFGNKMDIVDIQNCSVFESFAYDPAEIVKASTINPKNIGRRYKVLSNNRFLGLWDLKKKERALGIYNLKAPDQDFSCCCLSPDERWLFIGSTDGAITIWGIEYDYAFPGWADWDEEARPYLDIFLSLYPKWNQTDFKGLISQLQDCGYGWLRPEGVKKKLTEMTHGN